MSEIPNQFKESKPRKNMPRHSLHTGIEIIDGLMRLGVALGYVAETERPVERGRPSPPAVDVAWMRGEGQNYPLMIFEVESRATNSAANNPLKVYGQPTDQFEKPLFFFHIFVTAGPETTRIENLRYHYGSYNYRAYKLDEGGGGDLLKDILSQHRRLFRQLSLSLLLDELNSEVWKRVDKNELLQHIERLDFNAHYRHEYGARSITDPFYKFAHLRVIKDDLTSPRPGRRDEGYQTYIGQFWSQPIHLGLLALAFPHEQNWLAHLQRWQERSSYSSMIGPHFGLSRDYDEFILSWSPVLWALTAALMHQIG